MSISTPSGDQHRPSVVSTGKKPPAGGKPTSGGAAGKSATSGSAATAEKPRDGKGTPAGKQATGGKSAVGGRPGAKPGRPGAAGGGKGRKPITPVKVAQSRSWGPIALFVAVGVLTAGILGYGAWAVYKNGRGWEDRASDIAGLVNYRETNKAAIDPIPGKESHAWGPLDYTVVRPPVGSTHNYNWQNCMGDVYDAPIASEHAVHSMEHGAVWLTYQEGLPADQVETLASKIQGNEYTLMSPFEGLESTVSLQAWGYQLAVDDVNDPRIDEFIRALRQNATVEPGATCSGGITATGTTPRDIGAQEQQMDGGAGS